MRHTEVALKRPVTTLMVFLAIAAIGLISSRLLPLEEFPAITYQELIVDNTCMQLVMNPYQFDVMVMQNFYGDLVSGLCNGLAGGIGVVGGVSRNDEIAVFDLLLKINYFYCFIFI